MIQNLAWATGYNVIAILLAAGVLAHWENRALASDWRGTDVREHCHCRN
jgi:cation transport ATPase